MDIAARHPFHGATLRPALSALLALVVLAGCSDAPKRPGAAEPATAPATTAGAPGLTRTVGDLPEGIVYDPGSRLVAVAVRNPDRLQLLDPGTLRVVRSVPLPGSVRHLQLAKPGGPVLVPDESARELVQVTLPGGRAVRTKVGKQPHDASALANGDIVVGNEFSKSLSIVRGPRVVRTLTGVVQPGGVIGDGSTAAIVDVHAFTLSTYDIPAGRRTGLITVGAGPTHGVLLSRNRVAVTDTRGGAVLICSLRPLKQVARLATGGAPYGVAVDAATDTVWVTLTATNQVIGIDASGATPRVVARYATVRQPNTVAVAPGSHTLWVTGTEAGVVQRISR